MCFNHFSAWVTPRSLMPKAEVTLPWWEWLPYNRDDVRLTKLMGSDFPNNTIDNWVITRCLNLQTPGAQHITLYQKVNGLCKWQHTACVDIRPLWQKHVKDGISYTVNKCRGTPISYRFIMRNALLTVIADVACAWLQKILGVVGSI